MLFRSKEINDKAVKDEQYIREIYIKIENVRSELNVRMDENMNMTLNSLKAISDSISDIQKDNAVIMETLQLILTNMMLDNIDISDNKESETVAYNVGGYYEDDHIDS